MGLRGPQPRPVPDERLEYLLINSSFSLSEIAKEIGLSESHTRIAANRIYHMKGTRRRIGLMAREIERLNDLMQQRTSAAGGF